MTDFSTLLDKQRKFFSTGKTRDLSFRLEQLKTLHSAIKSHETEIFEVLKTDLNKPVFEAYATEVGFALDEIRYFLKNLKSWASPKKVKTPLTQFIAKSRIYYEPYGLSLIISPWNYPFQLSIAPLIASMGAGNCSIIKPSEYSPETSRIIAKIIGDYFPEEYVAVVTGDKEVNINLLDKPFDYIFFTGSVQVGKIVMEKAAKHLTPVTLELGGKSPCIIDVNGNFDLAAKRIVWGKFLNAGQTCVAPDYLLVPTGKTGEILPLLKKYIVSFYGENPCNNPEYVKIINQRHFYRLLRLIEGEDIYYGGEYDEKTLKISPTIIHNVQWDSPIMEEEIFGPLLPVLEYKDLTEVIARINTRPKPLALYLFTTNKEIEKRILNSISFGGGCINDTIVHLATPYMPFGGVGESGIGSYHGRAGFETFSHKKSVMKRSNLIDLPLRYPPYREKVRLLKKIMR